MVKLTKTKRLLAAITAGAMAISAVAFAPLLSSAAWTWDNATNVAGNIEAISAFTIIPYTINDDEGEIKANILAQIEADAGVATPGAWNLIFKSAGFAATPVLTAETWNEAGIDGKYEFEITVTDNDTPVPGTANAENLSVDVAFTPFVAVSAIAGVATTAGEGVALNLNTGIGVTAGTSGKGVADIVWSVDTSNATHLTAAQAGLGGSTITPTAAGILTMKATIANGVKKVNVTNEDGNYTETFTITVSPARTPQDDVDDAKGLIEALFPASAPLYGLNQSPLNVLTTDVAVAAAIKATIEADDDIAALGVNVAVTIVQAGKIATVNESAASAGDEVDGVYPFTVSVTKTGATAATTAERTVEVNAMTYAQTIAPDIDLVETTKSVVQGGTVTYNVISKNVEDLDIVATGLDVHEITITAPATVAANGTATITVKTTANTPVANNYTFAVRGYADDGVAYDSVTATLVVTAATLPGPGPSDNDGGKSSGGSSNNQSDTLGGGVATGGGGTSGIKNENANNSAVTPISDPTQAANVIKGATRGTVSIAPSTGATKEILAALEKANKNVNVWINYGNVGVRINGAQVTGENLKDLNFAASLVQSENAPAELQALAATLFPGKTVLGLEFAQSGDFGSVSSVTLSVRVPSSLSGKPVDVYSMTATGLVKVPASRLVSGAGVINVQISNFNNLIFVV